MRKINKILFITLSNIGDAILTLPALDLVLHCFPRAEITVLVGPRPKEIFQQNSAFETIVYDKHSSLRQKIGLFHQLKLRNFDLVVDLRNTAFGRMLPVKYKIFSQKAHSRHMKDKHLSGLLKFFGKVIDLELVKKKSLEVNPGIRASISELLRKNNILDTEPLVIISAGARSHIKRWHEEGFAQVCRGLIEELGAKIVLVGDRDDVVICQRIKKEIGDKALDLSGKTTIVELAALLERSRLLITNDSAVLHLAGYLNVPTLAIFGPTDENKYGPWSRTAAIVKKDIFCRPCQRAQCRFWTLDCMKLIKAQDVLSAAKKILLAPFLPSCSKEHKIKRILICRTDRIGDVLLSTAVIKALRDAYPHAYIAMVVSPQAKEIVEGNPYLDSVFIFDKKAAQRGFFGTRRFAQELKKRRFDLSIILHPTNRMHLVTFLAGIPRRIGYDKKLSFLLTDRIKHTKHLGEKHEMEYALDMVRYLGIEPKEKNLYMPLKKESEIWADNLLKEHCLTGENRLIVIHPTASCPSKIWPAERFAQVANQLILRYKAKIAIISAEKDNPLVKAVIEDIRSLVIDLSGQTSLSQLASLLKRAKLFISNDSGPVHIASAVGTPVISIFGRNQKGLGPQRWGPVGLKDRFLHKPAGCIECLAHNCVKDFACLKAITVEDVVKVAAELLESR